MEKTIRILLVACAVLLFVPHVVVAIFYWTVGGLYAAVATAARRP